MPRIRQVKTTFTAGEVSRSLLGRGDLRAYENGALTLRNVFIQPTGGVTRRAGRQWVWRVQGAWVTPRSGLRQMARLPVRRSSARGRAMTVVTMLIIQKASGYHTVHRK